MTHPGKGSQEKAERREALRFAVPYLIFMVLPLWAIVSAGLDRWPFWLLGVLVVTMAAVYVVMWCITPVAPHEGQSSRGFWIGSGILWCLALAVWLLGGEYYPEFLFLFSYLSSTWVFLAPSRLIAPGLMTLLALMSSIAYANQIPLAIGLWAIGITMGTGVVCWISRASISQARLRERNVTQLHYLAQERQRNQLASDLHDVLGQDLTGLSIKAELVGRLIDMGRLDQARIEAQEVAGLSREALSDMRGIVSETREWMLEREISNAQNLMESSGIVCHVEQGSTPHLDTVTSAMARVVREATTNILLHSRARHCWIRVREGGLAVTNDGYSAKLAETTAGSRQGLTGLRDSVADVGVLTWGVRGRTWEVKLEI